MATSNIVMARVKRKDEIKAEEARQYKEISDKLDELSTKYGFGTFRWALRRYDRVITMRRQTEKKIRSLRSELAELEKRT